jgi:hypothetical protein
LYQVQKESANAFSRNIFVAMPTMILYRAYIPNQTLRVVVTTSPAMLSDVLRVLLFPRQEGKTKNAGQHAVSHPYNEPNGSARRRQKKVCDRVSKASSIPTGKKHWMKPMYSLYFARVFPPPRKQDRNKIHSVKWVGRNGRFEYTRCEMLTERYGVRASRLRSRQMDRLQVA